MRLIPAKLRSSSGASVVLALLFLLICLTIGAVILTAASANAGRISHERAQQQEYLTVSSAAGLLRQELTSLAFTGGEQSVTDSRTGTESDSALPFTLSSDQSLPALLGGMAQQVFLAQTVYLPQTGTLPSPVQLSVRADAAEFDSVTALLSMDEHYNLTITLSLDGSPDRYPLVLTVPAVVSDSTATEVTPYDVPEEVDGETVQVTYTTTTSTRTVTVTWSGGTIFKGGTP